jgi:polysaccharide pyruvyl transferase WcaK-like protein
MIRGDREVNVPAWGHLLKRLRAEYACEIHYLQSCGKYDPEVRRELARQHVQLDDDGKFLGLKRVLQEVARRKLLITDRYHGVIYAILTGVPVVAAESSTHKTRGLLEAIGYPIPVLPPLSEGSVDDYIEAVARALADEDALRRQLLRVAGTAKSQLMQDYRVLVERLAAAVN